MSVAIPDWVDPRPGLAEGPAPEEDGATPALRSFVQALRPVGPQALEAMARRAQMLTRRHFGRTISLYVPLYLSNHCDGGCVYCGFAADRKQPRTRLEESDVRDELAALKAMGFEEVLLLTGECTADADFEYLLRNVALAAECVHNVTVESFAMETVQYRRLADAGCTAVTLYQETYDPEAYGRLHRWGPKCDYLFRLDAPARALEAGMRMVGIGALLGLSDPLFDLVALFRHALHLKRRFWQGGVSVSFPRIRPQTGGYQPEFPVSDAALAQAIFAFRLSLPDVPLVLSTRECASFRDGMAGVGISKMSTASRTTVGGYGKGAMNREGQFEVEDHRDAPSFCAALRARGLEPVFKNWDSVFRS